MQALGRLMKHFRLVMRMAQTTGTDVQGAMEDGTLPQEDWADMVQTCRQCGWSGKCEDWLDTHEEAGCAPENCLNRARFEAIRARADQSEDS